MIVAFLGGMGQEKVDVALVVHTTLHGAEGHSNLKQWIVKYQCCGSGFGIGFFSIPDFWVKTTIILCELLQFFSFPVQK
jgi:hypothetical protein